MKNLSRFLIIVIYAATLFSCKKVEDENIIKFSPNKITVSAEDGTYKIAVFSPYDWVLQNQSNWVETSKTNGLAGSEQLAIHVDKNNTTSPRSCYLIFTNGQYGISEQFYIKQEALKPTIEPELSDVNFSDEGGTQTINVTSNINYNITVNDNWLKCTKSGNGIRITVLESYTEKRTSKIELHSDLYDVTKVINVTQESLSITIDLSSTRISLGEKDNYYNYYNIYWSPDDRISCNGIISNYAIVENELSTIAKFRFDNIPSVPYNIIHPSCPNNITAQIEGYYPVVLPSTQNYKADSFDVNSYPMYGFTSNKKVHLTPLSGTLRIAITGETALSQIIISSEKGFISGVFDVNCQTGDIIAQKDKAHNQITINFNEKLHLKPQIESPIYCNIPAGSYGKIYISLHSHDNQCMTVKFDSDTKPIHAGSVREFAPFEFKNDI